jgi:hypothetical protein
VLQSLDKANEECRHDRNPNEYRNICHEINGTEGSLNGVSTLTPATSTEHQRERTHLTCG